MKISNRKSLNPFFLKMCVVMKYMGKKIAITKKILCVNHLCIKNSASISGANPANPIIMLFFSESLVLAII